MTSTHCAGAASASGSAPAACVPTTSNERTPAAQSRNAIAMPSIVTRSNGGWSRSAWMSSARTRPMQAASGSCRAGNLGMWARIKASASATSIITDHQAIRALPRRPVIGRRGCSGRRSRDYTNPGGGKHGPHAALRHRELSRVGAGARPSPKFPSSRKQQAGQPHRARRRRTSIWRRAPKRFERGNTTKAFVSRSSGSNVPRRRAIGRRRCRIFARRMPRKRRAGHSRSVTARSRSRSTKRIGARTAIARTPIT